MMPPGPVLLPADHRVRDSVARYGMAALGITAPEYVRQRLAASVTEGALSEAQALALIADVDALTALAARG